MENIIDLTLIQLISAYIFVLILFIIVKIKGIPREKEILVGSIRMTLQLVLVGYLLAYVFENSHVIYTVVIIIVMEIFAIINIFQRVKRDLSVDLKKVIALSLVTGTLIGQFYFVLVVLGLSPWYEPRYFITIAGMMIGNSMTGIALGVDRLVDGMYSKKHLLEGALMLGATPQMACKDIVNNSFDAAILPTLNSMVGMGIVFLPGMMTGQILSGISPLIAIEYQIAIMLGIVGCVSLTVFIFVQLAYKTFFNKYSQLIS
ncbi:MAG: membrane protein [Clostridiaceae bacterium BRH_c20a]|nr:MAG: membrane protein [Clostridiaceae bacterium BRH_c20a]